jgi:carboxyl-terminal processing protease
MTVNTEERMNKSERQVSVKWIAVFLAVVLLATMTFLAGFGTGFGTGRVTAPGLAAAAPPAPDGVGAPARSTPDAGQDGYTARSLPEEFDLVWEAWDALEADFYGDLPDTPEMVGGLVTGLLRAAEQETDDPLKRQQTADEVIAAVLNILQQEYGDLPAPSLLTYGAINGVAFRLGDDYTYLRTPEQAAFFNEQLNGSFEGIGARVAEAEEGGVRIVEPFEGQPAWNAGLRRGDVILAVDGEDITKMQLNEAISLIRGPKGTKVTLTVKSPDQEPRDVEVERDRIETPVVEYRLLDNGLAYLRLGEFSATSTEQVTAALDELLVSNPRGLILDLRGNPGGFLNVAVDISSEFVPEGPILIERFKDKDEEVYEASGEGRALTVPLAVLVNEGSASASEILAGAVQDSGRGVLIGERTFGKGSVQLTRRLSDDSQLSVTTARWFTPNDRQINGEGLEPDITVARTDQDVEADRDPQLDKASEYLLSLEPPQGQ